MNQEQNNFNMQGNNSISNNQTFNSNQIAGYNPQTGQPVYMNQNQSQANTNIYQQKKKKLKWWIPVLFFVGGFIMLLGNSVATIVAKSQKGLVLESDLLKNPIIMCFRWLAIICWLMVIPSLIIVIVKYNKKTPVEKMQNNFQTSNMINNNNSLDEKLLIAFIGNNYQQIMQKKFSVPALFLSWIYTLYRKIYIPSIIGMLAIIILGFLPTGIYSILVLAFVIVLGINFNTWYITYAQNEIQKIKTNNANINENELINICRQKGGTNIWLAVIIYSIFAIVNSVLF